MVYEETPAKAEKTAPKISRKNIIMLSAVLLICGAVAVNLIVFANRDAEGFNGYDASSGMSSSYGSAETTDVAKTDTNNTQASTDSYFSSTQVSRTRARDEALEVLQSVIDSNESDDSAKTAALADISQIAKDMEAESNIESLVMAKGFEQCVAVISSGNINVVVKADKLTQSDISIINEIVYDQAGISPADVKIIQK